jgi:hypothetical protein
MLNWNQDLECETGRRIDDLCVHRVIRSWFPSPDTQPTNVLFGRCPLGCYKHGHCQSAAETRMMRAGTRPTRSTESIRLTYSARCGGDLKQTLKRPFLDDNALWLRSVAKNPIVNGLHIGGYLRPCEFFLGETSSAVSHCGKFFARHFHNSRDAFRN